MPAQHSFLYPVRSYHTDASGRLFIHQLFNFLQDAAHQHANGLGFGHLQIAEQNLFWVLLRLTIEVEGLPVQGDVIELTTWVKSVRGSVSEREFTISLGSRVLVKASSLWFCLSDETHKPVRLPPEYLNFMVPYDSYATSAGTEKIAASEAGGTGNMGNLVTARYSDTDMVNHVNNAVYIRWVLDSFETQHFSRNSLVKLTVNYLNECFAGDQIRISWWPLPENEFIHELENVKTGATICRVKSVWSPITGL
jgi:acyl-ACP thioesterase